MVSITAASALIGLLAMSLLHAEGFRMHWSSRHCNTRWKTSPLTMIESSSGGKGFARTPRPNIITPTAGVRDNVEKFMMMYTCTICNGRNAQMVSKVAYTHGMVVSTCKHCSNRHLIADNENKMDMKEFGPKIENYLEERLGESVQRMTISEADLENYYLLDKDGVLSLYPKAAGQPPLDATIVDYQVKPHQPRPSTGDSSVP